MVSVQSPCNSDLTRTVKVLCPVLSFCMFIFTAAVTIFFQVLFSFISYQVLAYCVETERYIEGHSIRVASPFIFTYSFI